MYMLISSILIHLFYFIAKGETKMSVTIEVRDGRGEVVTATVDPLTGFIFVDISGITYDFLDPRDPDAVVWLKKVFGDKLDFLRRERTWKTGKPRTNGY